MQKVTILCVGKLKEKFYLDAVAEYSKRLQRHCRLEILELPEQRLPDAPVQGEIDAALEREAAAIREKLPKGCALVAMCIEGQLLSSEDLSRRLMRVSREGISHLGLLITWPGSCSWNSSTAPTRSRRVPDITNKVIERVPQTIRPILTNIPHGELFHL